MIEAMARKDFVLLIDDERAQIDRLVETVSSALAGEDVELRTWMPNSKDEGLQRFSRLVADKPLLVVTDYDLTSNGSTGLFGFSIVALAQKEAVPVGDYSRQSGALTDEPDVFEFRLPHDPREAGPMIAAVALGFRSIRDELLKQPRLLTDGSVATLLADLLDQPNASSSFSLYSSRLTSGNPALIQLLRKAADHPDDVRVRVATYVAGHLLFNSILRYPGPILDEEALHAYFASVVCSDSPLNSLFKAARYVGPFSAIWPFYWQDPIDDIVQAIASAKGLTLGEQNGEETFDQFRRRVAEAALGATLPRHSCDRCDGDRGGYWCPLTKRTVCDRADCSVPSSSWIPEGAYLTRVEHDFYEEWATLVGL